MAYTTYTAVPGTAADIQVPDDAELETSGVGAFNTPLEELANMASCAGAQYDDWYYSEFVASPYINTTWSTTSMADGTVSGGTAILVTIGSVVAGDMLMIDFDAVLVAGVIAGPLPSIQLVILEDDVQMSAFSRTPVAPAAQNVNVHLHGVYEVNADSTVKVKVQGMIGTSGESMSVVRSGRLTVVRMKQGAFA